MNRGDQIHIPQWATMCDLTRWKIGDVVQVCVTDLNREWACDWHDQKLTIVGIYWNNKQQMVEITVHDGYGETTEMSPDDFMSWM